MYKTSISFGMVYIPIKLELCVKSNDISFNQLDRRTMSRVRYKKTCDLCKGELLENKDIVKAYQYEKDRYVVLEDEDFEKIKSKRDKSIVIEQFVNLDEIDPIYYEKSYYAVPLGAEKAYLLLKNALEKDNKVGIAKTVLSSRESVIALRVSKGQMLINTLYFESEIRSNPSLNIKEAISKEEQQLAHLIIKNMSKPFKIGAYKDEYNEKLKKAIEAKLNNEDISILGEKSETKVLDLMDALKMSLTSVTDSSSKSLKNQEIYPQN